MSSLPRVLGMIKIGPVFFCHADNCVPFMRHVLPRVTILFVDEVIKPENRIIWADDFSMNVNLRNNVGQFPIVVPK